MTSRKVLAQGHQQNGPALWTTYLEVFLFPPSRVASKRHRLANNAGAGRVAQWTAAYGDPRNGADLVDWVERIPFDETRDYVQRVVENYVVYQARLAEAPEPRALAGALARR